ncbi:hypothetical protein GF336_07520 [Candidatus Woesearchaeota archaeon]|nr:hypothetical protein [Candidatus Woesearchaeota archaeon]
MDPISQISEIQNKFIDSIVEENDVKLPGHKGKVSDLSRLYDSKTALFFAVYSRFPKGVDRKEFLKRLKKSPGLNKYEISLTDESEEKEKLRKTSESRRTYIKTQEKVDQEDLIKKTEKEYNDYLKEKKIIALPEKIPPGSYWGRLYLHIMSSKLFKQEESLLKKINNAISSIYSKIKH